MVDIVYWSFTFTQTWHASRTVGLAAVYCRCVPTCDYLHQWKRLKNRLRRSKLASCPCWPDEMRWHAVVWNLSHPHDCHRRQCASVWTFDKSSFLFCSTILGLLPFLNQNQNHGAQTKTMLNDVKRSSYIGTSKKVFEFEFVFTVWNLISKYPLVYILQNKYYAYTKQWLPTDAL